MISDVEKYLLMKSVLKQAIPFNLDDYSYNNTVQTIKQSVLNQSMFSTYVWFKPIYNDGFLLRDCYTMNRFSLILFCWYFCSVLPYTLHYRLQRYTMIEHIGGGGVMVQLNCDTRTPGPRDPSVQLTTHFFAASKFYLHKSCINSERLMFLLSKYQIYCSGRYKSLPE